MDLHEAIGLLGLEAHTIGADYTDFTSKDVEKCFRQQALRHHPDKGGDASHFQLLHQAKDMLLEYTAGNTMGRASNCRTSDANSTAVSTSLYEHRTCVRQVLVVHGKKKTVIAATDDGLTVIELKKDATYYLSGGLERVVSFTTHRDDCSFLCCATAGPSSDDNEIDGDSFVVDVLYAGAKDGLVHKIELSTRRLTPWQLPSRERIVAISAVCDWVAIATADGGIYVFEYRNGVSTPTMVWKCRVGKGAARGEKKTSVTMTPETILLEEGSNSDCLNLWVGGSSSSSDTVTGRLVMWELDTHEDLFEQYNNDNDVEDLFGEYGIYESDTDSNNSEEPEDSTCDDERNVLAIDVTVQEGPIFSLSKHKRTIAVTAGQCIVVWGYNDSNDNATNPQHQQQLGKKKKLTNIKTIQTNNNQILYTLCINGRFVAAAGSGESIMVWDRDVWTMLHYLPLQRSPSGCCLATNCIMTLDWFHDDSGILVSGGYDGVVTMWTLANRLGSNDDTSSRGI